MSCLMFIMEPPSLCCSQHPADGKKIVQATKQNRGAPLKILVFNLYLALSISELI